STEQGRRANENDGMHAAQLGSEHRCRPQQKRRMNIDQWAREREQRDTEQPDRRRGSKSSERPEPARILQLGNELGAKATQNNRYGEDGSRSSHSSRHRGDVIADEGREY